MRTTWSEEVWGHRSALPGIALPSAAASAARLQAAQMSLPLRGAHPAPVGRQSVQHGASGRELILCLEKKMKREERSSLFRKTKKSLVQRKVEEFRKEKNQRTNSSNLTLRTLQANSQGQVTLPLLKTPMGESMSSWWFFSALHIVIQKIVGHCKIRSVSSRNCCALLCKRSKPGIESTRPFAVLEQFLVFESETFARIFT